MHAKVAGHSGVTPRGRAASCAGRGGCGPAPQLTAPPARWPGAPRFLCHVRGGLGRGGAAAPPHILQAAAARACVCHEPARARAARANFLGSCLLTRHCRGGGGLHTCGLASLGAARRTRAAAALTQTAQREGVSNRRHLGICIALHASHVHTRTHAAAGARFGEHCRRLMPHATRAHRRPPRRRKAAAAHPASPRPHHPTALPQAPRATRAALR